MVGPSGLEPPTSRLSGVRSNQLSYGPNFEVRDVDSLHHNSGTLSNPEFSGLFLFTWSLKTKQQDELALVSPMVCRSPDSSLATRLLN